ncbi:hypothetical protein CAE01nite_30570 [Cellulomonas aerilata]|uniref:Uncharacterized protein n=1 Tax=Cellulomonas aerilata TaxID=515326 RepID=A0A512DFW6_9CELL|nr:hypothetical protein CAE01nite_30570 [Cellulomonas aerilata]
MNDPGSHCGQVEQPSPEPVRRTAPPVTTMPICTTRFATRTARVQRRRPGHRGAGPAGPRGPGLTGAVSGVVGGVAAVPAGVLLTPPR